MAALATGLINTAEGKDWTQFAADSAKAADTASMSSESMDDVWCITDEQREYYVRQFRQMQDDLHGVISGTCISLFFVPAVTFVLAPTYSSNSVTCWCCGSVLD